MEFMYGTKLFAEGVIKAIAPDFSEQKKLVANEVIRKTHKICKDTCFKYKKNCKDCWQIASKELNLLIKKYEIEDSLTSPEVLKIVRRLTKRDLKLIEKLINTSCEGLTCVNYSGKEGGIIFTQEYSAKIPFLSSEKPDISNFSLGTMEYFGYGIWDGKEEKMFEKKCRDNLDIPENDVITNITKIDLSQIMK